MALQKKSAKIFQGLVIRLLKTARILSSSTAMKSGKGSAMRLSKNFTETELKCSKSGVVQFHDGFIDDLQELRDLYGRPIVINSGCRSKAYQAELNPKAPNSYHVYDINHGGRNGALAVDVKMTDSANRWDLIACAVELGWSIGVYKNFLHLDRRCILGHGRIVFWGKY